LDHSTHPLVEVVRTGTVRINNKDPLCLVSSEAELPQGWTSYLVPVKKGEGVLAVLATCGKTTAAVEQGSFLQTLEPLVDQVALALEHARLRGELRASQERALQAQKMEAVGQLTAGIAHNFNNILQSIMGNLQLALLESSEPISALLADAERSSRRAADMVRQLMLFARRNPAWTLKPVELRHVVEDGVSICRKTFDKKIELSVDIPDNLPLVHGDAGQLGQILLNLCLNARDALEAQDPSTVPLIQISLEDHVLADQQVGMLQAGAYICLQVADNGMGIEPQAQEHIFEPFFTTKEVGKGTGIGLATVYAIVRDHQGWIDCQSAKEKGTVFRVYLPVSSHSVSAEEEQQPQSLGGAETILVVDDEEAVRRSLAYAL
jgi:two-component system cell cycle sensor histidine kinase/response regulator CckA